MSRQGKIKNRDIPILSHVLYTMQDIRAMEEKREAQQERRYNITSRISGLPGSGSVAKGMDAALAAIEKMDEQYAEQLREYICELKKAERILNAIGSRTMRTFVTMFYVEHYTERQVREELNMSEWAFRSARERIEQAEDMQSVRWREIGP